MIGKLLGIGGTILLLVPGSAPARSPTGRARSTSGASPRSAGIGFTVSLFIAELAFTDDAVADSAKFGIFAGSILSAAIGAGIFVGAGRRSRVESAP